MFDKILEDSSHTSDSTVYWYILLIVAKFVKSATLIFTYDLLKSYHILWVLFLTTFISALALILLQAPFISIQTSFLRNRTTICRLIEYSIYVTIIRFLWLYALILCGPLRTILLFEHNDFVILACFHVMFSSSMNTRDHTPRIRGVVLFFCGIAVIFMLDTSQRVKEQAFDFSANSLPPDSLGYYLHQLMFFIGGLEHKIGIFFILIALSLRYAINSHYEKLVVNLGGAKQVHLISTSLSAVVLIPIAVFIIWIDQYLPTPIDSMILTGIPIFELSPVTFGVSLVVVSCILYLSDFYIEQYLIPKLGRRSTLQYGTLSIILSVPIVSLLWIRVTRLINNYSAWLGANIENIDDEEGEHMLSNEIILSILLFIFATNLFYSPIKRRTSSLGDEESDIEEASTTDSVNDQYDSLTSILPNFANELFTRSESRKILLFISLKLVMIFVELIYGISIESFALINDAYHMFWDCGILLIFLYPMSIAEQKANRQYSFGYSRIDVVAGYINGIRLFLLTLSIIYDSSIRLFETAEIVQNRLAIVSITDLFVNVIGVFLLRHDRQEQTPLKQKKYNYSWKSNLNMRGVYLHVWAAFLNSIAVIISSFLIEHYNWYRSEPICSIIVAIFIIFSLRSFFQDCFDMLLLQTPSVVDHEILNRIVRINHVLSYSDLHFWSLSSSEIYGTVHIQVAPDADEQEIQEKIIVILKDYQINDMTIQIEKPNFTKSIEEIRRKSDFLNSMSNKEIFLR